jgi:hypothetical protein
MNVRKYRGSVKHLIIAPVVIALLLTGLVIPWIRQARRQQRLAVIRAEIRSSLETILNTPRLSAPSTKWCTGLIRVSYINTIFSVALCGVDRETCIDQMSRLEADVRAMALAVSSSGDDNLVFKSLWDRLAESGHCGRDQVRRNRLMFEQCMDGVRSSTEVQRRKQGRA